MMDTWRVMLDAAATLTPVAIFVMVIAYVVIKSPLEVELKGTYRVALRKNGHVVGGESGQGVGGSEESPPLPIPAERV